MYIKWNFDAIFKYIGQLLYFSSYALLIPVILSFIFKEPFYVSIAYFAIFITVFIIGFSLYKAINLDKRRFSGLNFVHYLAIICIFWFVFSFFSALPLVVVGGYTIIDSMFETMSMMTTTGLTVLPNLPVYASLIFWRSILAWVGGIGLVLLAFFGVLNAEFSFNKLMMAEGRDLLRPNIKNTIKHFWIIYFVITLIGIILLMIFGMNLFNSINFTMAAISTTGLQIGQNDALYLANPAIQLSLVLIMILGATSFLTHDAFYTRKKISEYFKDSQFVTFILVIFVTFLILFFYLRSKYTWTKLLLLVTSAISGGGFKIISSADLVLFPYIIIMVLLLLMFIGGSTNSTSGGITTHRFILLIKTFFWKIKETILPETAYFPKKHNGEDFTNDMAGALYFFILIFVFFLIVGTTVLVLYNFPILESFFEVLSAQSNVGLSYDIATHSLPTIPKIMLYINMWIGRLEIIPFLGLIGLLFQRKIYF